MIMYNFDRDECKNVEVDESTFTIAENPDGTFTAMTYAEWEALRCTQACEAAKARAAAEMDAAKAEKVAKMLDAFTEGMHTKYLKGARSWGQIYNELVDDFEALAE